MIKEIFATRIIVLFNDAGAKRLLLLAPTPENSATRGIPIECWIGTAEERNHLHTIPRLTPIIAFSHHLKGSSKMHYTSITSNKDISLIDKSAHLQKCRARMGMHQ